MSVCESNCLHEYLQHVWLSFCVCSPESWVRSHGAAAERHTPDDPWSRPGWVGSDPLGYKRPLPAGMTGEPLELHSVRGKPKSMEDTHLFCLIIIDMAETVRSWQTLNSPRGGVDWQGPESLSHSGSLFLMCPLTEIERDVSNMSNFRSMFTHMASHCLRLTISHSHTAPCSSNLKDNTFQVKSQCFLQNALTCQVSQWHHLPLRWSNYHVPHLSNRGSWLQRINVRAHCVLRNDRNSLLTTSRGVSLAIWKNRQGLFMIQWQVSLCSVAFSTLSEPFSMWKRLI